MLKKYILILFLICDFIIVSTFFSIAQNAPITTAATIANAVPGAVDVPLTVTGFTSIGAVSLSIDYDYAVLHFTGGTPNPLMPSFPIGDLDLGTGYHRLTMGWFGSGVTLTDGSAVMTLHFNYISGITTLAWHDNGPSCEYADADYNILNDIPTSTYYINGFVCGAIENPGPITGNNELCAGQSGVDYSIAPVVNATGYNWTIPDGAVIVTGQNTNAITVDYHANAISGNISVYGINDCGSGPASTLPVIVDELPIADAGQDFSIPYGTSTSLSASSGGSGTYSYHWTPEALLINPNVQNPQTVILTTTSVFTLLVTNLATFCQSSDEVVVTITGGPLNVSPVALPDVICQGETSQLYSNAGGGSGNYTYDWTSDPPGSPPWSSNLPNPIVSPDSSRHYMLMVNDGFTTVTGSTFLAIEALPSATISGGDTLCGNELTALRVDLTGTPPWSFTYTFGSTSVFVENQPVSPYLFLASDPGDYTVTAIEDANCSGVSYGTAVVRKYPVPAIPEITLYGNELISSSCCGNQWYLNDEAIPGETGQTYHATVSGLYFVVVTLNGCSSDPSEVVDMVVGIDEINAVTLCFYPNPAKTQIKILASQNITGSLKISICSASGNMIREYVLKEVGNTFTINISDLAAGLYFLIFSGESIHSAGKLVIRY